jgi:hypothetical protein
VLNGREKEKIEKGFIFVFYAVVDGKVEGKKQDWAK